MTSCKELYKIVMCQETLPDCLSLPELGKGTCLGSAVIIVVNPRRWEGKVEC